MERLGTALRKKRLEMGLGLRNMEVEVGVSRAFLSYLENGKKLPLPKDPTVERVATWYGLDSSYVERLVRFTRLLLEGESAGLLEAKQFLALDLLGACSLSRETVVRLGVLLDVGPVDFVLQPLSNRLRLRRSELNMTLREMAQRLPNDHPEYVWRYENDLRVPFHEENLERFAQAYRLDRREVEVLALFSRRLHRGGAEDLDELRRKLSGRFRKAWPSLTNEVIAELRLTIGEDVGPE